jgi:hypothetical protein
MSDQTPAGIPEIRVGDKLSNESAPFLGVVTVDQWEEGKYGTQWHLAVRPVEFSLQGETGAFHTYYGASTRKRSKMGAFLAGARAVSALDGKRLGHGEMIGLTCWWVRRDISFGKDDEGEERIASGVLVPVKSATDEELARAGSPSEAATPADPEWTDEEIQAVLAVLDGKRPSEAQVAAAKARLSPELKNAIFSGHAIEYLTRQHMIELDGEGRVRLLESRAV